MFKQKLSSLLVFVLMIIYLTACLPGSLGPQAWIDQPAERNNPHALQPYVFQAHSSDADGIVALEFSVDGEVINTINTGGNRMEERSVEWRPFGPGTYTLSVRAQDGAGNFGSETRMEIVILGDEELAALTLPETEEPVITEEIMETEEVVETEEVIETEEIVETQEIVETEPPEDDPPPDTSSDVQTSSCSEPIAVATQNSNCRQGPSTDYGIVATILKDQEVPIVGRSADGYWWVLQPPDKNKSCWIAEYLVDVENDICEVAVVVPPPPPVVSAPENTNSQGDTGTESGGSTSSDSASDESSSSGEDDVQQPEGGGSWEMSDTTPPNITSVTLSNDTIYLSGCSSHEQSTTLTVFVTDPSGIDSGHSTWSLGEEGGAVTLNYVGADRYSGFYGNVSTVGTMSISGTIFDNAGNYSGFSKTVTVKNCID